METDIPSFVHVMFQVTDPDGAGIPDLKTSDFELFEDGMPISPTESAMYIRKRAEIPYTLKTVLALDNRSSVESKLDSIKKAAINLIKKITGATNSTFKGL